MILQILFDGGDQFGDACETASAKALVGQVPKPSFHEVQPRAGRWNEMQMETGVATEPGFDSWMFVGAIIVHDQMEVELVWCLRVDFLEEPDELLMPMTRHAVANNLSVEHAQCGKQCRGTIAFVIVGHGSATALLQGKAWLGAVQRLNLALFVDRQD